MSAMVCRMNSVCEDTCLLSEFPSAFKKRARESQRFSFEEKVDWPLEVDITDSDTEYLIVCKLPGILKSDLDVNLDNRFVLPVDCPCLKSDSYSKQFSRTVPLPMNVNVDSARCTFTNFILCIRFRKNFSRSLAIQYEG